MQRPLGVHGREARLRKVKSTEFSEFEWDETKANVNFRKHGITFPEAAEALANPHLEEQSDRDGEVRILAICLVAIRIIGIVYTVRGNKCRIITARGARDYEQREYRLIYPG